MMTLIFFLIILWSLGVFEDDSCDCCHTVNEVNLQVEYIEDDIETINSRLSALEERNGLSHPND